MKSDIFRFAVVLVNTERLFRPDFTAGEIDIFACCGIAEDDTGEQMLFGNLTHITLPCPKFPLYRGVCSLCSRPIRDEAVCRYRNGETSCPAAFRGDARRCRAVPCIFREAP